MALVKCVECGNMVSERASACVKCGCPIQFILNSQERCPKCGSPIDSNNTICTNCGYLLKLKKMQNGSGNIVAPKQRRFNVELTETGPNKDDVIALMEITGLSLARAKEIADCAPIDIMKDVLESVANDAKTIFEEYGAKVTLKQLY